MRQNMDVRMLPVLFMLLITYSSSTLSEPETTVVSADGVKITTTTEVKQAGGAGTIYRLEVLDILTDAAGKRISDQYAVQDTMEGALFCAGVGLAIPAGRIVATALGISCALATIDLRAELRKGDQLIKYSLAGVAGGVGAAVTARELALGKRNGKTAVLFFTVHPVDKTEAESWAQQLIAGF